MALAKYLKPILKASCLALIFNASWPLHASTQGTPISYEKQIAPLLAEKCVACHNHTTRQGGLNLESHAGLLNGGKRGAVIVPGKSAESLLVRLLEGSLKPQMPLGDKLSAAEIRLFKDWIDAGGLAEGSRPLATPESFSTNSAKPDLPDIKPNGPVHAAINSLAFHPNGWQLAIGRYQEAELCFIADKSVCQRFSGHSNEVRSLVVSPDGKLLATAGGAPGQFGEVKVWDVATGKELRNWRGHRDNIFAIAFSPDGKQLATCSYDKLIKLWDTATGNEVKTLKDHTDAVFALAFSPNGKLLASASADRTVKLWDVASGARLFTLSDALDAVNTLVFHPSGKLLAGAGADRSIRIWEISNTEGKQLRSLIAHEDAIHALAWSPDGKTLVSTGADRRIKFFEAATLTELHVSELQSDWVFALAFTPDGKRLAAGRYDGTLSFYDTLTGKASALK